MARRWVDHFSSELSGSPSAFEALQARAHTNRMVREGVSLQPPSLDEVLHVLRACSKGKALGPNIVIIELVVLGGLPAARLLHGIIAACLLQGEAPLFWKGGRFFFQPA